MLKHTDAQKRPFSSLPHIAFRPIPPICFVKRREGRRQGGGRSGERKLTEISGGSRVTVLCLSLPLPDSLWPKQREIETTRKGGRGRIKRESFRNQDKTNANKRSRETLTIALIMEVGDDGNGKCVSVSVCLISSGWGFWHWNKSLSAYGFRLKSA